MTATVKEEKKSNYYDQIYRGGYTMYSFYPVYREVIRMVKKYDHPRVLELGSGVGDLGKMLVEAGISYRGFDFSEEAVKIASQLCPKADFHVGDLYDETNYTTNDFNVCVSIEVLEHVDDLKVISMLPPGTRLVATVPNFDDPAHLRVYDDPAIDIIKRFVPFMHVTDVLSANAGDPINGFQPMVHLFHAIRLQD